MNTRGQLLRERIVKSASGLYFKRNIYEHGFTLQRVTNSAAFTPFFCNESSKYREPTELEFKEQGGFLQRKSGRYYACSNDTVTEAPSSVCKLLLERRRSSMPHSEQRWTGPNHVYLQLDGQWIRMADLDVQLSSSSDVPLVRSKKFYGKYVTY
jgi:hypothetical protein